MPPNDTAQTRAHVPLQLAATGDRREYSVRMIRAGRITRADGSPGPFIIPAEAITDALRRGLFTGLAAFVDHPDWFQNHSLRNLAGITTDALWNGNDQSADGTIRLYPNAAGNIVGELFDAVLDDAQAGDPIPNVGLSLVFWPSWKPRDDESQTRELAHFRHIQSVDFVFSPAADGRIKQAMTALSALALEDQRERDRIGEALADAYPELGSPAVDAGAGSGPNITPERSTTMPPSAQ